MASQKDFDKWLKSRASERLVRIPSLDKDERKLAPSVQDVKTKDDAVPSIADVVIITALPMELDALERACLSVPHDVGGKELRDGVLYKLYRLPISGSRPRSITVAIARQDQMGMTSAAILATKAIRDFQPAYVAMTGICAGVPKECNLADVVVADTVYDYGSGKIVDGALAPDPRQIKLDVALDALLTEFCGDKARLSNYRADWPDQANLPSSAEKLCKGVMASGSAVVADAAVTAAAKEQQRKLLAIEMEAYGIAHAAHCSTLSPNWLVIKAVSDFADKSKNDAIHSYAAYLSSRCLVDFIILNAVDLGIADRAGRITKP
jgi:nucleoside phosphorylase